MKCLNTNKLTYWTDWDYNNLSNVITRPTRRDTYNDIIIMADTETSKSRDNVKVKVGNKYQWDKVDNYIVCWSIAILNGDEEYVLYGRTPSEFIECITKIHESMEGKYTYIYFHNLAYDYQFLRKFLVRDYGVPINQLNIKPLYPLFIEYGNGICLRDSLMLAQRKLEKWAEDLNVIHKKAVGKWDYDKIRNQNTPLNEEELEYIQNDVLAGVECIRVMCDNLNVYVGDLPYTNTGIVRREIKLAGKANNGHRLFEKIVPNEYINTMLEKAYHGGYTHGNRDYIGWTEDDVTCYDFSSSYPYVMLSEKFPMQKFEKIKKQKDMAYIIENSEDYAFLFRLMVKDIKLHIDEAMPSLSYAKCDKTINAICDNGRILQADFVEIVLTEQELITLVQQYDIGASIISDLYASKKDYLPKWLTDKVYEYFTRKTQLKDGNDPIMYQLMKGMLNAIYGLMCEHTCRAEIQEDYENNEYKKNSGDYSNYASSKSNVLLYQWGVWITAYAQRNLYDLGACCKEWLYCDTDSVYGRGWDEKALKAYNDNCISVLESRGYKAVKNENNGKYYMLGIAEYDGHYNEFKMLGAKRYASRNDDGKLKITVAGVPKKTGAECLNDDINNFKAGFTFDGNKTGKKTHYYIYKDDIWTDEHGNECGDSIDLVPCDYELDRAYTDANWQKIKETEVSIQVYE